MVIKCVKCQILYSFNEDVYYVKVGKEKEIKVGKAKSYEDAAAKAEPILNKRYPDLPMVIIL